MMENRDLKVHVNKYHVKYHNLREIHFKNQFRLQELEDARDKLYEANQRQKISINKYLDVIRKHTEKMKQMEHSLKMHTTRGSLRTTPDREGNSEELKLLKAENERLTKECHELQEKLNECYNLIDELEFELETVSDGMSINLIAKLPVAKFCTAGFRRG